MAAHHGKRDGGISTSMAVTLDGLVLANGHYEAAAYEGGGADSNERWDADNYGREYYTRQYCHWLFNEGRRCIQRRRQRDPYR